MNLSFEQLLIYLIFSIMLSVVYSEFKSMFFHWFSFYWLEFEIFPQGFIVLFNFLFDCVISWNWHCSFTFQGRIWRYIDILTWYWNKFRRILLQLKARFWDIKTRLSLYRLIDFIHRTRMVTLKQWVCEYR